MLNPHRTSAELSPGLPDRLPLPAPLPGWRRYICRAQSCGYQFETLSMATAPDCCSCCGQPWQSVSQTIGPPVQEGGLRQSATVPAVQVPDAARPR